VVVIHALFLVAIALATPAVAQTPSLQGSPAAPGPDSAAHLNAAGRWGDALRVARARMPIASVDERCSLRIDILVSLERLGMLDGAASEFKTFDPQCSESQAIRARAAELAHVRSDVSLPPLPTTGLDFSAVGEFWRVADLLSKDVEPSEDDWRRMMSSVGYRLSIMQVSTTRTDMDVALRPSRAAEFDSLTKMANDQADRLRHFRATLPHRAALDRYRDSLARSLPVEQAVSLAARFLPPNATEGKSPPLVGFGLFRDDAYSLGPTGVVVDLDHVYEEGGLTELLAHEFHHSYLSALSTLRNPERDSSATLYFALRNMRNEGIADLIDKPHPLSYPNSPLMSGYAKRYNEAYARTPAVIHSIDSALVVAAEDSTKLPAVGRRVNELLPSAGHYNGSYVAREIYETFGVDSLYPGVHNFFAFLRTYTAAEAKRGNPPPFSPKAVSLLDALERKYLLP
jgi:Putative zinc dependent peptidase (DUF5700)